MSSVKRYNMNKQAGWLSSGSITAPMCGRPAAAAEKAIREKLACSSDIDELLGYTVENIRESSERIMEKSLGKYIFPAPFDSLMIHGCIQNAKDASLGAKYTNYGIHGAGLATAVDSLSAVSHFVFGDRSVSAEELLSGLENNFEGYDVLYNKLRYSPYKFGNGDDESDRIACILTDAFAESLKGKKNDRGGIFRAGTGSAMYYITYSKGLAATADGRKAEDPIPANYSPSLYARCRGPVSVVRSFTKPDLSGVANGGPLTLELHDSMFRNKEGLTKTAGLVETYVRLGGHQLQLNAVNRDCMKDAQKHPDKYRNLIVRVWGWSGYFVELDKEYQDHIIARCEYGGF